MKLTGENTAGANGVHHIPKLADGRIRQYSFQVIGGQRHHCCQDSRKRAHNHHRFSPIGHILKNRVSARQQVHARVNHRRGMNEGAYRGRRFHRIRQPGLKGKLSGFRRRGHQEAKRQQREDIGGNFTCRANESVDVGTPGVSKEHQRACQQPHTAC